MLNAQSSEGSAMKLSVNHATDPHVVRSLVGGKWRDEGVLFDVMGPETSSPASRAPKASEGMVNEAVAAAFAARSTVAALPGHERAAILRRVHAILLGRSEQIAASITRETGKTIRETREEVRRASDTIALCAEEAIRIEGYLAPLDGSVAAAGKIAMMLRFPVGVVAAIVPFNAPVNLTCHKIGPALAAGNSIVVKSPPEAPASVEHIVAAFAEAKAPAGAINLIHGDGETGEALIRNQSVNFITFTGSSRAGAMVKAAAGMRRVLLELGGLGPNIVHRDADVDKAAKLTAIHGTRLSGQSCMSVQNIFVHEEILHRFLDVHVHAVSQLIVGKPTDEKTDVGPLLNEAAAVRIETWLREAAASGARILCGGRRHGATIEPTVVTDVKVDMKVVCQEIFGPVMVVHSYTDIERTFEWINGTGFGLNCGVFTGSIDVAFRALRSIECGGVIINGSSTFRPDQVPYGGVKNSGIGREGPRYAIREMTNERLVVFNA
jgi:acyl-CoA reductase-like NAD-dependent aldehyde dehydrogenase